MSAFAGRSVFAFFDALSLRTLSAGVARREAPAHSREECELPDCAFRRAIPLSLAGARPARRFAVPSFLVIARLDRAIQ